MSVLAGDGEGKARTGAVGEEASFRSFATSQKFDDDPSLTGRKVTLANRLRGKQKLDRLGAGPKIILGSRPRNVADDDDDDGSTISSTTGGKRSRKLPSVVRDGDSAVAATATGIENGAGESHSLDIIDELSEDLVCKHFVISTPPLSRKHSCIPMCTFYICAYRMQAESLLELAILEPQLIGATSPQGRAATK